MHMETDINSGSLGGNVLVHKAIATVLWCQVAIMKHILLPLRDPYYYYYYYYYYTDQPRGLVVRVSAY